MAVAVFLDTNILDGLPESLESGELSSLVGMVWHVFVPDVVAREWMHHRIEKVIGSLSDAARASRHLAQYGESIVSAPKLPPGFGTKLENALARRLRSAKLRILRPPRGTIRDLTQRAAQHVPPFADRGRGFKDELVIRCVEEALYRWSFDFCIIVSADKDLSDPDVKKRIAKTKVGLSVVRSIKEAITELEQFSTVSGQQEIAQAEQALIELAKEKWPEIVEWVKSDISQSGVSDYELDNAISKPIFSTVRPIRLLESTPLEISGASLGVTHVSTGRTLATIRVKTRLGLLTQVTSFWPSITKVTNKGPVARTFSPEESERSAEAVIDISVEATVASADSGKLSDLQLVKDRSEYYRLVREIEGLDSGNL